MSRADNWGKPERAVLNSNRRYAVIGDPKLNELTHQAPNALQLLLEDDVLASGCQSLAQYRQLLSLLLKEQFAGIQLATALIHTAGRITAPITASGRAFGLIPEGKGWADDLINWSTREFRNPADAARLMACWNACENFPSNFLHQIDVSGEAPKAYAREIIENYDRHASATGSTALHATIDDTTYGN